MMRSRYGYDRILGYRARYYSPIVGRFVSEDPIGFVAGVNFYEYGFNDPIDNTDPSGLDVLFCERPLNNVPKAKDLPPHSLLFSTNEQAGGGLGPKKGMGVLGASPGQIEWENPYDSNGHMKAGYSCGTVSRDNCVEKCVIKRLKSDSKNPPKYKVGDHQCSQYTEDVMSSCESECRRNR
jgi:RHS repeat-associated protein